MQRAIVVGAGLGGLATAIRLRRSGWDVAVLEKNSRPGGRCNVIREQGFTFDTGPTLLLMRDVLDDVFTAAGQSLAEHLDLARVHPNYRVTFGDGDAIEVSSELDRLAGQAEAIEPGAGAAFRRFLADAGFKYRVSRSRFVERNFVHWYNFVTLTNLYYLLSTNALRKLDRHVARFFRDPRLNAAFTFQAMYLGLAPHDAPAVYSLLPYTELAEGIWFPRGGMYRIVEALVSVAAEMGVAIETDCAVREIRVERGRVVGVGLANGEIRQANVVVSNADLPYTYRKLVPRTCRRSLQQLRLDCLDYGCSAFLLYLGVDKRYPQLLHHNVFLSREVRSNFDAIFRNLRLPDDPSLYVCVPNRTDPRLAPGGCESMYVLVPVPRASSGVDWQSERGSFRDRVVRRLVEVGFTDLSEHIVFERVYTPCDFVADYNIERGSAFGISHRFSQVGYLRPSNKASSPRGLYFVGASTVPGGGVPMVLIGSRLTAQRIVEDQRRG